MENQLPSPGTISIDISRELMGKDVCRTPHPLPSLFSGGGHQVHARDRVAFLPL